MEDPVAGAVQNLHLGNEAGPLRRYRRRRGLARSGVAEKYQLTPTAYEAMLTEQGGVCAICGKPESATGRGGTPRRLAVDRDHRTGKVRQLLCHRCNLVTWAVEGHLDLLDAVHAYLAKHS